MTTLPLDDARTYEMLARGDSTGVFQFESEGMREALKKVRPDEFNDLVALNALYRPGAMDQIPVYAKGKHNPETISYPDERLRAILESSNGVILYQEQAMQISKEIAGFSGAKADDLRKAIGKKNRAAMAALKPEFVEGCRASGTSSAVTESLWQTNEKSADYSFNKSHAACYGLIAYRTAWLKANYPAEYMAALISSVMSTKDKVPFFVARCEEMGIEILPPDVNLSRPRVHGRGGQHPLRPGRRQGRRLPGGRGDQAGPRGGRRAFSSLWDFCERVDNRTVNKKAIEALIKCGAFGSTGATRKGMLAVLEQAQGAGQKAQQDALIGQGSIFDLDTPAARSAVAAPAPAEQGGAAPARRADCAAGFAIGLARPIHPPIPTEEFEQAEFLAVEKEAIGLFVSAHPLKPLREVLRARVDCPLSALADRRDKDLVTVGGIITEAKRIRTRNGDPMMFATLDDLAGAVEMIVFGKAIAEHEAALAVDQVVLVRGRVDHKEAGKTSWWCSRSSPSRHRRRRSSAPARQADAAAKTATALAHPVRLRIDASCLPASAIEDCKQLIEENPGPAEVVLEIDTSAGTRRVRLGETYRVQHTPTCCGRSWNMHALVARVATATRPGRPDGLRRTSDTAATAESVTPRTRGLRYLARAASSPARFPRARGLRGSRPGSRARRAASAGRARTGTPCSPPRRARRRRGWRGGRGLSRAGSGSR